MHFGVAVPVLSNAPEESYPGSPGVVVREEAGQRVMQSMTWGFPHRPKTMKPTSKPIAINNIADLSGWLWKRVAYQPEGRCLIPLTGFAEPEGPKGAKTRTWFSLRDQPIFAWAGLWKISDEWGPVYSGLMTDANEAVSPIHDRMPVLLMPNEYDRWLHGTFKEALTFQSRVFPSGLIEIDRTDDLW
jgi:putative SOS response-associated peptidase YedK